MVKFLPSFHTTKTSTNRRQFLKNTAWGVGGLASCSSGPPANELPSGSGSQPNVLIIYTDEHSNWTLGAYGGKVTATPHLDSIGREGAIFNNFFVNSAVCTPSRGCLITGRYPHSHGAYKNNLELGREQVTLAHLPRRQGYETGMAGKWHLDGEPRPGWIKPERSMGFDDCQWMYNRGHWKRVIEKPDGWPHNRSAARAGQQVYLANEPDGRPNMDYSIRAEGEFFTDWLTGKALEFIKRPRDKPFFYYLSIPDPHGPDTVRAPYDTMFQPEDTPIPPTLYQEDLPDWAAAARDRTAQAEGAASWQDPKREQVLRKRLAQYYGMVKCIDDNVGRILDTLREQGRDASPLLGGNGVTGTTKLSFTTVRWSAPASLLPNGSSRLSGVAIPSCSTARTTRTRCATCTAIRSTEVPWTSCGNVSSRTIEKWNRRR